MSTFLYEFVDNIQTQWKEIDVLIEEAEKSKNSKTDLYDALCRSITVISVAHFDGFLKDFLKALVCDLNKHVHFRDLPKSIKRTYCKNYFLDNTKSKSNDKSYENKMNLLIEKFSELECPLSYEPYFLLNKNPTSHNLKTVFENLGIDNIFSNLYNSDCEVIFSCEYKEILSLFTDLKKETLKGLKQFPYDFNENIYNLKSKKNEKVKTLWEEFIEEFNKSRHEVAHGNIFENRVDIKQLAINKLKIMIIELCLTIITCNFISKKFSQNCNFKETNLKS